MFLAVSLNSCVSEGLKIVEHDNPVADKVLHDQLAARCHFFLLLFLQSFLLHHPFLRF